LIDGLKRKEALLSPSTIAVKRKKRTKDRSRRRKRAGRRRVAITITTIRFLELLIVYKLEDKRSGGH